MMKPMYWVFILGAIGVMSLIAFVSCYIKDKELKKERGLTERFLILDWTLLLVMVASFACAVFVYLDIQNQINSFTF
ncbi:hypothetical protein [Candidatus Enterococcus murrayae]|uniref:Uncharacterized protein n=1 Tax=Candidatus Enterococcus murrayae TaxID=2815321 RepID=A0ABS3HMS6_9ENTE|nr:hypothetical protein [Enterococcus sp. MJM16]MBO0454752.1 hypothetical protein [Enterococcus sp. MJM16]